MPKAAAGSLTGGTGDVNPQWYRTTVSIPNVSAAPGSNAIQQGVAGFPTPVPKFNQRQDKSIVMELLKVMWTNDVDWTFTGASPSGVLEVTSQVLTKNPAGGGPVLPTDGSVVDNYVYREAFDVSSTAIVASDLVHDGVVIHDLTDGAGHGILIATDNVYIAASVIGYNTAASGGNLVFISNKMYASLLYRFKEVALAEYIGIVQSQQ